jgi:hypothetical protein
MSPPTTDPPPEYVTGIAEGWWECLCGNEPHFGRFTASDRDGSPVDPGSAEWDQRTNVCRSRGRIFVQDTGLDTGRRRASIGDDE